jgi:hypothetical protein
MLGIEFTVIFIVYAILKLTSLKLSENNEKIVLIALASFALIYKLGLALAFGIGAEYSPYLFVEYKNYDNLFVGLITNCAFITYLLHNYIYDKKIENTALIFALISAPTNLALASGIFFMSWFLPQDKQVRIWSFFLFLFVLAMTVFEVTYYSFYLTLFGLGYLAYLAINKVEQEKKDLVFALLFIYVTSGPIELNIFQLISYSLPIIFFAHRAYFVERINDYWLKCFFLCLFSFGLMQDQSDGLKSFLLFLTLGILFLENKDLTQFRMANFGRRENLILAALISSVVLSPLVDPFLFGEEITVFAVILIILMAVIFSRYIKDLEDNIDKQAKADTYKLSLTSLVILGSLIHVVFIIIEYDLEDTWHYTLGLVLLFGFISFGLYRLSIQFSSFFERIFILANNSDKYGYKMMVRSQVHALKKMKELNSDMEWPEMLNISKSALFYGLLVAVICAIVVGG